MCVILSRKSDNDKELYIETYDFGLGGCCGDIWTGNLLNTKQDKLVLCHSVLQQFKLEL